ncbi:hypothetical protein HZH66_005860 [Vespula vulgaris]|uniref:Uncharacterized protein n=2 Tax=Vespula TaxID=7451 RepID=A0A834P3W1_VESPE|nr:hypothetical protein HZH66_005860 [Vespula vulgaris]KAF7427333.1 hypothetical protein H0235_007027 [Vespula pensylvanica]
MNETDLEWLSIGQNHSLEAKFLLKAKAKIKHAVSLDVFEGHRRNGSDGGDDGIASWVRYLPGMVEKVLLGVPACKLGPRAKGGRCTCIGTPFPATFGNRKSSRRCVKYMAVAGHDGGQ